MTALTRLPSGRRASTIGLDSSTRRPIRDTILSMMRRRCASSAELGRRPRPACPCARCRCSSGPLTMTSVTSGSRRKRLDRAVAEDVVGDLLGDPGAVAALLSGRSWWASTSASTAARTRRLELVLVHVGVVQLRTELLEQLGVHAGLEVLDAVLLAAGASGAPGDGLGARRRGGGPAAAVARRRGRRGHRAWAARTRRRGRSSGRSWRPPHRAAAAGSSRLGAPGLGWLPRRPADREASSSAFPASSGRRSSVGLVVRCAAGSARRDRRRRPSGRGWPGWTGWSGCRHDDRSAGVGGGGDVDRGRDLAPRPACPGSPRPSRRRCPTASSARLSSRWRWSAGDVEHVERLERHLDVLEGRHVERGHHDALVGLVERGQRLLVERRARCRRRRSRTSRAGSAMHPRHQRSARPGRGRRGGWARPAPSAGVVPGEQRRRASRSRGAPRCRSRARWCGSGTAAA